MVILFRVRKVYAHRRHKVSKTMQLKFSMVSGGCEKHNRSGRRQIHLVVEFSLVGAHTAAAHIHRRQCLFIYIHRSPYKHMHATCDYKRMQSGASTRNMENYEPKCNNHHRRPQ